MTKGIDSWMLVTSLHGSAKDVFAIDLDDKYCYLNMDGSDGGYVLSNGGNSDSKSFAAYKGYVTVKVYLPCVGYVELDANELLGKVLHFRLVVDYYTGKGMYLIGVSDNYIFNDTPFANYQNDKEMRIISTYECDIGVTIPLGQSNTSDIARNIALSSIKTTFGVMTAYHGMSLPPATSTQATVSHNSSSSVKTPSTPTYRWNEKFANTSSESTTKSISERTYNKPVNKLAPVNEALSSTSDALNRSYPTSNSDRVSDTGLMRYMSGKIHIVIYRPVFLTSGAGYEHQFGYPYNSVETLNRVYGYTEVSSIHFENSLFDTITSNEKSMLEQLMANGIILPDPPDNFYN